MSIEKTITCPFGSKCEEIKDGKLLTCSWYTHINGKDPQSESIVDKAMCAIAWIPVLLIENAQMINGVHNIVGSLRDETIVRQDAALQALVNPRKINVKDIVN